MANWAFEIDHADNYIVGLTEVLVDKGFRIWCFFNDGQPLYLFSSAYLSATADEQVNVQARQLVRFIDGLSYLLFENKGNVNKITLTTVFDVKTFSVAHLQRTNSNRVSIDFSGYRPMIEDDESPIAYLLKLVPSESFIRNLLLLLSQGMDVKPMLQVYDYIKTFLADKGDTLTALGFSKARLDRFVQGDEDAMPLREAQELIVEIVFAVLEKYYRIHLKHCVVKDNEAENYDSIYD